MILTSFMDRLITALRLDPRTALGSIVSAYGIWELADWAPFIVLAPEGGSQAPMAALHVGLYLGLGILIMRGSFMTLSYLRYLAWFYLVCAVALAIATLSDLPVVISLLPPGADVALNGRAAIVLALLLPPPFLLTFFYSNSATQAFLRNGRPSSSPLKPDRPWVPLSTLDRAFAWLGAEPRSLLAAPFLYCTLILVATQALTTLANPTRTPLLPLSVLAASLPAAWGIVLLRGGLLPLRATRVLLIGAAGGYIWMMWAFADLANSEGLPPEVQLYDTIRSWSYGLFGLLILPFFCTPHTTEAFRQSPLPRHSG
ncbi:MAG: hypothetical protein Q7P63_02335 [Verrucomicrobiota bacterium JB022]|nr:hypothetical protein [Verrucomicrobiota bacterium JB022]